MVSEQLLWSGEGVNSVNSAVLSREERTRIKRNKWAFLLESANYLIWTVALGMSLIAIGMAVGW